MLARRHAATLSILCLAALGLPACNGLTGIGGVTLAAEDGEDGNGRDDDDDDDGRDDDDDDDDDGDDGDGEGDDGSDPATTGNGGAPPTGATTTVGAGGSPAGTTSSAAATTSATSGGASACEYPAGSYGTSEGAILDPGLSWSVYLEGSEELSTLSAEDLLDCDGTGGTNAVLLIGGVTSCGACQMEASEIPGNVAAWDAMGIRVVYLMFDSNAAEWRDYFELQGIDVGNDPQYSLVEGNSVGTPLNIVVDPRDMQVVMAVEGYGGSVWQALEGLAQSNGG
jgi:hypothetical protein